MKQSVGVIGLGRMGGGVAQSLAQKGFSVYGYDPYQPKELPGVTKVADMAELLSWTRRVLLLVPAGEAVDGALATLLFAQKQIQTEGLVIVDGGNSLYTDSQQRATALAEHGIGFVDAGLSGGVHGLKNGYCVMAGGSVIDIEVVQDVLQAVAAPDGYAHVGPAGSGHYVKMVHNGIEYGMLQAYAEGMHLLKDSPFNDLDLAQVSKLWEQGSVIRSWLLELLTEVLADKEKLESTSGEIHENGTGRWTLQEAKKRKVPVAVIEEALKVRSWSRQSGGNYATVLVALLREAFGGHAVEPR